MSLLTTGDTSPSLRHAENGGGTRRLPDEMVGSFAAARVYQGPWFPCCTAQLAQFRRQFILGHNRHDRRRQIGARIVAQPVDHEAATKRLVDGYQLTFTLVYPVGSARCEHAA